MVNSGLVEPRSEALKYMTCRDIRQGTPEYDVARIILSSDQGQYLANRLKEFEPSEETKSHLLNNDFEGWQNSEAYNSSEYSSLEKAVNITERFDASAFEAEQG